MDFVVQSRLPSMSVRRESVDAGGLISYGADLADQYLQGSPLDAKEGYRAMQGTPTKRILTLIRALQAEGLS